MNARQNLLLMTSAMGVVVFASGQAVALDRSTQDAAVPTANKPDF
jgi:hypothetical protein